MAYKEQNGSTGHDWCKQRNKRRANKQKGHVSGKNKGLNCQASTLDKYMCAHNRSHKHPEFGAFRAKIAKKNTGGSQR